MAKDPLRIAVLAGGSGTRFWPAGRRSRPKQLLALAGDDPRPLLRLTVDRVRPLTRAPLLVVAPRALRRVLTGLLPELGPEAFVWEPVARNTCAAVALAAHAARAGGADGPLLVVPADQHVAPLPAYRAVLRAMAERARRSDAIVTLGLRPDHPATGYGYLQCGAHLADTPAGPVHAVQRFVEKPAAARARALLRRGGVLWNGGTFAFRPSVFLAELERLQPEVAAPLAAACARPGAGGAALARAYAGLPSISVDHAVMERARRVEVVAADLHWDDLGSWDAVARHRAPDGEGNRVRGDATLVDSRDCLVDAEGGHVALLGVADLVVVRRGDALLVARRGRGEDVRAVVRRLEEQGREDLLR